MVVRALTDDGRRAMLSFNIGTPATQSEVQLCDLDTGEGGPAFRIPYGWAFAMSADGSTLAVSPKSKQEGSNRVDLFSIEGRRPARGVSSSRSTTSRPSS